VARTEERAFTVRQVLLAVLKERGFNQGCWFAALRNFAEGFANRSVRLSQNLAERSG